MSRVSIRKYVMVAVAVIFALFLAFFLFKFVKDGREWAFYGTNRHVYTAGEITEIGEITDMNGNTLAVTKDGKREYSEDKDVRKATLHLLGDRKGNISTGVQYALKEKLTNYSLINGIYTYSGEGNNMQLTVNSDISVAALKALGKYSGCVGVYNYKTGETLCMVSTPTVDVDDKNEVYSANKGIYEGVYVNRFISSAYTPGSVFKAVTSAAAYDKFGEGIYDISYECDHGTVLDGRKLGCVGKHGNISLEAAFSHSCNAYYSNLAVDVGIDKMTEYAEKFGFNRNFYIEGIKAAAGSYNLDGANDLQLGSSGIGQHTVLMNPLQFMCAVGAVANGGDYAEPYLVESITTSTGVNKYKAETTFKPLLDKTTADLVYRLMDFAVEDNYRKSTFGKLDVCGKTGTAEVGDGVENSVFVGFCKNSELPLAFVVVVENGGSGKTTALSVANKTLQTAYGTLVAK